MRVFRELLHDDPHRRTTRSDGVNPAKDEGDLFTRRPSARKLRVLIDEETLGESVAFLDDHLEALLGYENVECTLVRMTEVAQKTMGDERVRAGYVRVEDVTEHQGRFSFPGPRYAWKISDAHRKFDGSTTLERAGGFSPEPELTKALMYRYDGAFDGLEVTDDDVNRAVLLTELGRAMGYDLIISESPTTGLTAVPANDRANVVTRAEAIPIIAHYLRTQQRYILNATSHMTMSRRDYFDQAVGALAEGITRWRGKCQYGLLASAQAPRYIADADSLVDRLSRALRSRDTLIASIGAIQTEDVIDDGADALDHCLICLCGAIDVLARSLYTAQQFPGSERSAKLHLKQGFEQLIAAYAEADGIDDLHRLQKRVNVVFSLRNSIHTRTLAAISSLRVTPQGSPAVNVGQIDIVIPEVSASEMSKAESGGLEFWAARSLAEGIVVVDLMTLVDRCFRVIFEFLDQLCRIVAAESITDKDPILTLDVIGVQQEMFDSPREMRVYLGIPTDDDLVANH